MFVIYSFFGGSILTKDYDETIFKALELVARVAFLWPWTLIVSACGGNKTNDFTEVVDIGFSSKYVPPLSNFERPSSIDPHYKILEPSMIEGYWLSALEMDNGPIVTNQMLIEYDRSITFSFPVEPPDYIPVTILGWSPATPNMMVASNKIFSELITVLDISIEEIDVPAGLNNFSISQSIQSKTAGFSYFPNAHYQIGSDVFISKDFSDPSNLADGHTNYSYEVLVHEIGHALGLKHPFEEDGKNSSTLHTDEDQSKFTVMTYNHAPSTFDGNFRSLDWMALTKLYGVNSQFRAGNDKYTFNHTNGTFIIDGNGIDTISEPKSTKNIFIDLRPGTHSYEGQKSDFITAASQLTISHGSDVENVETGSGNDKIVGNHLSNIIKSGAGDDEIFAGEGADVIYPGLGKDVIDLSEIVQAEDRISLEILDKQNYETIYGFVQGIEGDILDITDFKFTNLIPLPLVDITNVPSGYIDTCLVRVFGEGLDDKDNIEPYFSLNGSLETLKLSNENKALVVTAGSQATGENQHLYIVQNQAGSIEVNYLAQLAGNHLDIDNWSADNFIF